MKELDNMNANNLAWMKGAAAFTPGDTIEMAKTKAAEQGYRPYNEGYGAFITAYAREVRMHQPRPEKKDALKPEPVKKDKYRSNGLQAA